ncbi:MAG: hypothetical protein ACTIJ6_09835 [Leucobacter sp.]
MSRECVSLVGESGSGKTTSLMTVLRLNRGSGLDCEGDVDLFGVNPLTASEALTRIDMTVQTGIAELLRELCADRGLGLLLVSYDLALVSTLADRVIVVKDGAMVDSDERVRVLPRPSSDYTVELINTGLALGGGA